MTNSAPPVPPSQQNTVDWNNAITGSPANTIDLNMTEVNAGTGGNGTTNADTGTK